MSGMDANYIKQECGNGVHMLLIVVNLVNQFYLILNPHIYVLVFVYITVLYSNSVLKLVASQASSSAQYLDFRTS